MTTKKLEQDLLEIQERLAARRAELEPMARRLAAIPGELVDAATDSDRAELHAEYSELEQERALLLLEVRELEKRERLARLAVLQDQEQRAKAALDVASEKARAAKDAAQEAATALLRLQNGGYPPEIAGDRDKCALHKAELQGKERHAWAVSANAGRAAKLAGRIWEQAKTALEQAEAA